MHQKHLFYILWKVIYKQYVKAAPGPHFFLQAASQKMFFCWLLLYPLLQDHEAELWTVRGCLVLSSGPLEAKEVGDKDNHSTPSLGKVPLQPEEPGWGQGKLHYETARVLQLSVSWISKQLSNCHRLHLPLP